MKLNIKCKDIFLLVLISLIFAGCAKMVAPTGGPKDEQHPLIVKIDPPSHTTNFESKKVKITFDEFIQLKDLKQNLIVSPLLEESPIIMVKGKTLDIEFEQELEDSTTYNIYFGNSVQDFNEGNPIENFEYVLSTGNFIDSMSVQGLVLNSFNLQPEGGVLVMLYDTQDDSLPFKQIPNYISKTNDEGLFRINNIRIDDYKVFCIRDLNKNYLFDIPDEEIAFTDSIIAFKEITETVYDTIYVNDTINVQAETQVDTNRVIDTILSRPYTHYVIPEFTLMLFEEDRAVQYLNNSKREQEQKIEFIFNKPIKDSVIFSLVDTIVDNDWYIKDFSANNDTLVYWLTDSVIYKKEKLLCAISYQREDSNIVYQWNTDTLSLRYFEKKKKTRKDEEAIVNTKYKLNVKNRGALDLNKNVNIVFEKPLSNIDKSKINLFTIVDTIDYPIDFEFNQDTNKLRNYELISTWGEDSTYRLEIYPEAFTDISEISNDTNIIEFKTRELNYYGKFLANITGIDSSFQLIAQVIIPGKEKEQIIREKIIKKDQIIDFDFLYPKEYLFKVIIDKNFNGKWDEGNYLEHIFPEEVLYYEKTINVKANWDIEIDFNTKKE